MKDVFGDDVPQASGVDVAAWVRRGGVAGLVFGGGLGMLLLAFAARIPAAPLRAMTQAGARAGHGTFISLRSLWRPQIQIVGRADFQVTSWLSWRRF